MTEGCPECGGDCNSLGSHKSWENPSEEYAVYYYQCKECDHKFATKDDRIVHDI